MLGRLRISPERYFVVACVALVALTLIVFTGAAVRVTGSGLGCPAWPPGTGGGARGRVGHARLDRVRQPAAVGVRRAGGDRRRAAGAQAPAAAPRPRRA